MQPQPLGVEIYPALNRRTLMNKKQTMFRVGERHTLKGKVILFNEFPSRSKGDKKWREYSIFHAGFEFGKPIAFLSSESRDNWITSLSL
jgi:hypothetical protein